MMAHSVDDDISDVLESVIKTVCDGRESATQRTPLARPSVGYVFSKQLLSHCNRLPKVKGRAILVHELMAAYGLLSKCVPIASTAATVQQLRAFHSQQYLDFVERVDREMVDENDVLSEELNALSEEFGIAYDCPPLPQLYHLIACIAGSSICAAEAIIEKKCDIAINWCGGWHHANRDEASGFCYTNDVVLAILRLLDSGVRKVLYIDLDVHHGDGVESAFAHTSRVLTLSFHKHEIGFFPGSGRVSDVGFGSKGRYYSVNVPLKDGITDGLYVRLFTKVLEKVGRKYCPQVIVCQCGADGLNGDPVNSFNLTLKSYGECINYLKLWRLPMILLGGGGYNMVNTSRLWTYLSACVLNVELDNDIPDHSLFLNYRPSYELHIEAGNRANFNSSQHVHTIMEQIFQNIEFIK